jgi:hypothetical protein
MDIGLDLFIEKDTRAKAEELLLLSSSKVSVVRVGDVSIHLDGPIELAEAIANAINAAVRHKRAALNLQKRRNR